MKLNEEHLMPNKQDRQWALDVEKSVKPENKALYMECMNQREFSARTSPRDVRDGCILTGIFLRCLGITTRE